MDIPPLIVLSHETLTFLWVVGISAWGGVVSYFEAKKKAEEQGGRKIPFKWSELLVKIISSSFVGFLTAWLCMEADVSDQVMGVLCGVAGYMGTPAIVKLRAKMAEVLLQMLSPK